MYPAQKCLPTILTSPSLVALLPNSNKQPVLSLSIFTAYSRIARLKMDVKAGSENSIVDHQRAIRDEISEIRENVTVVESYL